MQPKQLSHLSYSILSALFSVCSSILIYFTKPFTVASFFDGSLGNCLFNSFTAFPYTRGVLNPSFVTGVTLGTSFAMFLALHA